MTRGIGLAEWLADLPEAVVALAAVVTQLGDLWFLTLVLGTLYWLGRHTPRLGAAVDRDRMVLLVGLLLLGIALTETLKAIVAVSRPTWFVAEPTLELLPGPLSGAYAWLAGAEGYGFPSGHAIATTVGWGGLAWAVRAGRRRRRIAVATLVVTAICLARLVLGVHYLVDVLAGVAVGLAALAVVIGGRRWPLVAFGLATAVAVVGVGVAGLTTDTAGVAGLALGATGGWILAGRDAVAVRGADAARWTAVLGVVLVLPPLGVAIVGPIPPVGTFVVALLAGAALIVLPLVGERVERKVGAGTVQNVSR